MSDKTWPLIATTARMFKWYPGMYITSTTGGGHARRSYHYRGEAVDFGSGDGLAVHAQQDAFLRAQGITRWDAMNGMAEWWYHNSSMLSELEHTKQTGTGGWYVKNGKRVSWVRFGLDYRNHRTHVHVAVATYAQAHKLLVVQAQKNLNFHGAHVTVDGDPGPQYTRAVMDWQRARGLRADGVVGDLTAASLR